MKTKAILMVLTSVVLVGCETSPPHHEVSNRKSAHSKKSEERLSSPSPKYVSFLAPREGQSEPVFIGLDGWTCVWRTIPSGQPLRIWVNGESKPILFFFGQTPVFMEKARFLQFGSPTGDSTYVKVVLYPPGMLPDLSVVSE